jgi:hypothetical protein
MTALFWTLWTFAALTGGTIVFFFAWGLTDGTVAYSPGLWMVLLAVAAGVVGGGLRLHRTGRTGLAAALALLLALPGALYALFLLLVIVSGTRWN